MIGRRTRRMWRTGAAALAFGWRAAPAGNAALVVLKAAAGACPVLVAWLAKLLIDELARGGEADVGAAVALAAAGAVAGLAGRVVAAATQYVAAAVKLRVSLRAERHLFDAVNASPGLRNLEDPAFYDRLQLADHGAQSAPHAVTELGAEVVQGVARVGGFAGALFVLWPPMALLVAAAAVPELVARQVLANRHVAVEERLAPVHRRRFSYRALLTDVRAGKEIRLLRLADLFGARMAGALRATLDAEVGLQRRIAIYDGALALLAAATLAAGTVVAVHGVVGGALTLGDLTLFVSAIGGVQGALSGLLVHYGRTRAEVAMFEHFLAVVAAPPDLRSGPAAAGPLRGAIELRDVWFRYDPAGPWILRGVNLIIPAGRALGLVGVNGAGKSTLVKLLCRFYDPQRGRILWDGVDLRELDIETLRRRIGATFQDVMAYDLTARENIGIGDLPRMTEPAAVHRAARLAGVHETVSALPRGYDTLLSRLFFDGDEQGSGHMLSGGQWQRVALARSMMRVCADLLILDEPSSGLDAAAEHQVHRALRRSRRNRTSVLISHRLCTLRDADEIAVLGAGRVIERGNHDELMAAGGEYARLFTLQAAGYQDGRVPAPVAMAGEP